VSTDGQSLASHDTQLHAAGCVKVLHDHKKRNCSCMTVCRYSHRGRRGNDVRDCRSANVERV